MPQTKPADSKKGDVAVTVRLSANPAGFLDDLVENFLVFRAISRE